MDKRRDEQRHLELRAESAAIFKAADESPRPPPEAIVLGHRVHPPLFLFFTLFHFSFCCCLCCFRSVSFSFVSVLFRRFVVTGRSVGRRRCPAAAGEFGRQRRPLRRRRRRHDARRTGPHRPIVSNFGRSRHLRDRSLTT